MAKKKRDRKEADESRKESAVPLLQDETSAEVCQSPVNPSDKGKGKLKMKNLFGGLKRVGKRGLQRKHQHHTDHGEDTDNSHGEPENVDAVAKVDPPSLVDLDDGKDNKSPMPDENSADIDFEAQNQDEMDDSDVQIEEAPPIGEIVADEKSEVSDIPVITDEVAADQLIYNPESFDVCFGDYDHPGTKKWLNIVKGCLDKFADKEYSPPVYKAIKKRLKGRRFLIRVSREPPISWREATKPEIIECFGECFNKEKRKLRGGGRDDTSEICDSLEGSEGSISLADVANRAGKRKKKTSPASQKIKKPSESKSPQTKKDPALRSKNDYKGASLRSRFANSEKEKDLNLRMAISACHDAQDYSRPYDDMDKLQQGIAAEQKLNMLLKLSSVPHGENLRQELELLEDLSRRMKYASMAPLFLTLEKVEKHMTEYFQSLAEQKVGTLSSKPSELSTSSNKVTPAQTSPRESGDDQHTPSSNSRRRHDGTDYDDTPEDVGVRHNRSIMIVNEDSPSPEKQHQNGLTGEVSEQNGGSVSSDRPVEDEGQSETAQALDTKLAATVPVGSEKNEVEASAGVDDDDSGEVRQNSVDVQATKAEGDPSGDFGGLDADDSINDGEENINNHEETSIEVVNRAVTTDDSSEHASLNDTGRAERTDTNSSHGNSAGEDALSGAGDVKDEANIEEADEMSKTHEDSFEEIGSIEDSAHENHDRQGYEDEGDENIGTSMREATESLSGERGGESGDSVEEGGSISVEGTEEEIDMEGSQASDEHSEPQHVLELKTFDQPSELGSEERDGQVRAEENTLDDDVYSEESDSDSETYSDGEHSESNMPMSDIEPPQHEEPLDPKIEQFFDHLHNFFEVRRKMEEHTDEIDPSEKIRNLKMKLHSGGIARKNGKFKKEYQQHDLRNKVIRSLDDLYEVAQQAQSALKRTMYRMTTEVKGMDTTLVEMTPLKPRDRAYQKAKEEYSDRRPGPCESWVYDIVRCSVICKSYKQMSDINRWLGKNVHIVKSKNRFESPTFNGYRDLMYHVSIPYRGELNHICEIQVHHKDIKVLDEQFDLPTHRDFFRSSFAGSRRPMEDTLRDLEMLNEYGDIGGELMTELMKSKDPDQLQLFAGICREKLDDFDRALELYRRLLMKQEKSLGPDNDEVASTHLFMGLVLGKMGETEESLFYLRKALTAKEKILGSDNLEVADSCSQVGHMLRKRGDFNGALGLYRKALQIQESKLGGDHILVVDSLRNVGDALTEKGDFNGAIAEYYEALNIQKKVLGDEHEDVAATHAMIGKTLYEQGDFERSMEEHLEALEIREASFGKNEPITAESHTDLGVVLSQKFDYDEAEWRHRKALRIRQAILGKDHQECAVSHSQLGLVLSRKGDNTASLKELREAVSIRENILGRDNPLTCSSYVELGDVLCLSGKCDDALQEYRRAMVIRESILGELHPDTAASYSRIGKALNLKGKHSAAISEHKRAIPIFEKVLGEDHPRTATAYQAFADTLKAKGNKEEALTEYRKALASRVKTLDKNHPDIASSCSSLGTLLLEMKDTEGALAFFRQALSISTELCGEEHPVTATAHIDVGRALISEKDLDGALEEFRQTESIREILLGDDHDETAEAYSLVGSILSMLGRFEEAEAKHNLASPILESYFGHIHPNTVASRKKAQLAAKRIPESEL